MDALETRVIHRDLARAYPTLVRGEGIYLYDADGNRYIDGSGGSAAVTAIGHAVPEVLEAMIAQASQLAYAPTHAFTTDAIEACARLIIEEFAPPELVAASRPSEIPRPVAEASPVIRYTPGPTLDDRRRSYPDAVPPSMSAGGRVRGSTSDVLARFAFGGDR